MMKWPSGLFSYWHTSAPTSGAPRSAGKRRSTNARIARPRSGEGVRSPHVGAPAVRADRRDRGLAVRSANPHQLARHGIAGQSRREISAFVFEADARDAIEADLWPASGGDGRIDSFELEPELAQEWQRLTHVAVVRARHPQHARWSVELLAGRALPLAPE